MSSWWGDSLSDHLLAFLYNSTVGDCWVGVRRTARAFHLLDEQAQAELDALARQGFVGRRVGRGGELLYGLDTPTRQARAEQQLLDAGLRELINDVLQLRRLLLDEPHPLPGGSPLRQRRD